ncbi:MAG: hypothetical protein K1000chlam2_01659 [Chlamydiae bacterium]|nr:hypothetical protein [Chlamydiota bacterium]
MLKKWIAEILALAISASSLTPLQGQTTQLPSTGNVIIQEVETTYRKGEYDNFLEQIHEQFQSAGKAGVLRGIFESAKTAMKSHPLPLNETMLLGIRQLDKVRNQRLLDAISENPELEIVNKIDSIVFNSPSLEHTLVLSELDSLKYHMPEDAKGTIENKISSLETEYYIKSLLLEAAAHHSKSISEDFHKKKIALVFEKLDKMQAAAKDSRDPNWQEKIEKAQAAYRTQKAFNMDFEVLKALAIGKVAPENSVEEKVKEIMMDYLQQKDEITSNIAQN